MHRFEDWGTGNYYCVTGTLLPDTMGGKIDRDEKHLRIVQPTNNDGDMMWMFDANGEIVDFREAPVKFETRVASKSGISGVFAI